MKAALYARTSSEAQKKNQNIQNQVFEIRKFATQYGVEITTEYLDDGVSGTKYNRPALLKMYQDASDDLFDIILVYDPDRIAREDIGDVITAQFRIIGKRFVSIKEPHRLHTPSDDEEMVSQMLNAAAKNVAKKTWKRMLNKRHNIMSEGKRILACKAPYGFDLIQPKEVRIKSDCPYTINESEASVVRLIFSWLLKERYSLRKIVSELNRKNIPAKYSKNGWGKSSVVNLIKNELYICKFYHFKFTTAKKIDGSTADFSTIRDAKSVKAMRDPSEWKLIRLPESLRILSDERFALAQKILSDNKTRALKNSHNRYLLRTLCFCRPCNESRKPGTAQVRFYGMMAKGNGTYRCVNHAECGSGTIRQAWLEMMVWEDLTAILRHPDTIFQESKKISKDWEGEEYKLKKRLKTVESELAKWETRKGNLIRSAEERLFSMDDIRPRLQEIKAAEFRIKEEREFLTQTLASINPETVRDRQNFWEEALKKLVVSIKEDGNDFDKRRLHILSLIERIEIDQPSGWFRIHYKFEPVIEEEINKVFDRSRTYKLTPASGGIKSKHRVLEYKQGFQLRVAQARTDGARGQMSAGTFAGPESFFGEAFIGGEDRSAGPGSGQREAAAHRKGPSSEKKTFPPRKR